MGNVWKEGRKEGRRSTRRSSTAQAAFVDIAKAMAHTESSAIAQSSMRISAKHRASVAKQRANTLATRGGNEQRLSWSDCKRMLGAARCVPPSISIESSTSLLQRYTLIGFRGQTCGQKAEGTLVPTLSPTPTPTPNH